MRRLAVITATKGLGLSLVLALVLLCSGLAIAMEAEHEPGAHAEEAKGWVATDTYRVMNFAVLAGVLIFLLRKPLAQGLGARIKGIEEQLHDLEAKRDEAARQLGQYETRLGELEKEAEKIVSEYKRHGEAARERILAQAKRSAERLQDQARRNMEQAVKLARDRLRDEMLEMAVASAENAIRKKATHEDQERLVREYIEKVVSE
ncbi:ATP synthase F0 subunit B [Thermodesulfobacteriota bacterium]